MKRFLESAHVLHGFAQERAIEWAQDFISAAGVRTRMLGVLEALAERSGNKDERRYWRLTNDGSILYARDGTFVSMRPDVAFGSTGIMQLDRTNFGTCTVLFATRDRQEEDGALRAKFNYTVPELRKVFAWFDRTGLVHAVYDERALLDATRMDRIEAAFEAFLATA